MVRGRMTYFALSVPAPGEAMPGAAGAAAEVVIEVAAPGGGGGWIYWRHVSGPCGATRADGGFETEEEALADACRQLGATDPREVSRPR